MNRVLFQAFIDYAEPFLPKETVNKIRSLRKLSDLRFPSEWFPAARGMQRFIGHKMTYLEIDFSKKKDKSSCRSYE